LHASSFPTLGYAQRLYDFLRRHPTWVDGFWAVVLFGISVLGGTVEPQEQGAVQQGLGIVVMLLLSPVVALRRRMPEQMLVLAAAGGVCRLITDVPTLPANFAMLVIVYPVAAIGARWASRFALTAGLCAAALAQLRWPNPDTSTAGNLALVIFQTVPFAL